MRRLLAVLFTLGLVAAACGDDDADATPPGTTTTTTAPTTTTEPPPPTPPPDDELPGERIEIFPYEGAELAVVGVAADDTLNVRVGPGVDFEVLFELEPLATGIIATGHNRSLDAAGFWSQITVDGQTGWANTRFLSHLGQVTDITSDLFPMPADRTRAETMLEIGEEVAAMRASDDPPSEIVVVGGPTVGDLGEIVVDVIGFGDDSVGGERLHIFAEPDAGGETFTVRTVESTLLCLRDVTDEGICV